MHDLQHMQLHTPETVTRDCVTYGQHALLLTAPAPVAVTAVELELSHDDGSESKWWCRLLEL